MYSCCDECILCALVVVSVFGVLLVVMSVFGVLLLW